MVIRVHSEKLIFRSEDAKYEDHEATKWHHGPDGILLILTVRMTDGRYSEELVASYAHGSWASVEYVKTEESNNA